jgi:hypothetical protein
MGSDMGGSQAILFDRENGGDGREQAQTQGQSQAQDDERSTTEDTSLSPVNGVYRVASDHRKDGSAVGW